MPHDLALVERMRPGDALDRPTDLVIAELAAVQHGRVASWQLAIAGVTPTELRGRVAAGRLHREFRGVYAVGHAGAWPDARRMFAVLASVMRTDPEGLFGDQDILRMSCPRCGARHAITREALEAYMIAGDS